MKTKFFFISLLIGFTMCMVSCNNNVSQEKEKELINAIYQSLDLTPEQFAETMTKQGLHEAQRYEISSSVVLSFTNVNLSSNYRYKDQVIVEIIYTGNVINTIGYSCYLNGESNIAAYYKLFSDRIAEYGYTDWRGYYADPAEEPFSFSSGITGEEVADRTELCGEIQDENLRDKSTMQYYVEEFVVNHDNLSLWNGRILLSSNVYEAGISLTGSIKDIHLSFTLERK